MARQAKVTTFGEINKGQTFQIVNNGFAGTIYAKRDRWTASVVESSHTDRPLGKIVDIWPDTQVTRCLTTAQKVSRRNRQTVAA